MPLKWLNIRQQLSLSLSPSILRTNSTVWHLHVSNIWYRDIGIAVIAPTSLEAETPNRLVKVEIESFILVGNLEILSVSTLTYVYSMIKFRYAENGNEIVNKEFFFFGNVWRECMDLFSPNISITMWHVMLLLPSLFKIFFFDFCVIYLACNVCE